MKESLNRFLALDCATTNTGFAVYQNDTPVTYGKLFFDGDTEYEKAMSASRIMFAFLAEWKVPVIVMESSFLGINPSVATNLAISHGAVIGAAALQGVTAVATVVPIQWQMGIGNPRLTREEKRAIMNEYPAKSAAWYKKAGAIARKERTIKIVKDNLGIDTRDNDVADALGIGLFATRFPEKVRW